MKAKWKFKLYDKLRPYWTPTEGRFAGRLRFAKDGPYVTLEGLNFYFMSRPHPYTTYKGISFSRDERKVYDTYTGRLRFFKPDTIPDSTYEKYDVLSTFLLTRRHERKYETNS